MTPAPVRWVALAEAAHTSAAIRSKPSLSSTTANAPTMPEDCLTECCTVTFSTP